MQSPHTRPLTTESDVEIHSDCLASDSTAVSWEAAQQLLELFHANAANESPLVEEDGLQSIVLPHSEDHDRLLLDQATELRMSLRQEHHVLWTTVISLTGVPHENGEWLPPIDFANSLLESWSEVRRSLYNIDGETEYLRVMDVGQYGYPRLLVIVMTDGQIDEKALFENVADRHCEHSTVARREHHTAARNVASERSMMVDNIIENRLAGFLDRRGGEHERAFSTNLWAGGFDRFKFSQGSRSRIDTDASLPFDQPTTVTK